ncbi:MAG TPA: recombinase family protein [Longimicrobium sp.]|jgi:DNA invertase Pin-like site-specific DNA recombinase|uniref:recombinase family protein n=1 Tax=Longimicrobium sp. TaxID=2029185 RepID=UPI002ED87250
MNEQAPTSSDTEDRLVHAMYIRPGVARRDDSIKAQLQAIRRRAEAEGFILPPELEFGDDGSSGLRMDRPRLLGLLDRIRTSPRFVRRPYVEDPTRISRGDPLWSFMDELRAAGIEVRYLSRYGAGGTYVPASEHSLAKEIVDRIHRAALQHAKAHQAERRCRWKALRKSGSSRPAHGVRFGIPRQRKHNTNSPVNPNGGPA